MHRIIITGAIVAAAGLVAIGAGSAAHASVTMDDTGHGFVGKGDVQNALGYANNNAFTDADARSATFTAATAYSVTMTGVKCSTFPGGFSTPEDQHVLAPINIGHYEGTVNTINATPKISGGKVTGYNLTGIGAATGATTPNTTDFSKWATSCPEGERFAGWVDPANVYSYALTTGDLTASVGSKTAALPNTPIL